MSEDEAGAASPVPSPRGDAVSTDKLKDLIVRDRDQIVQKGLGFFEELSQKELHLAEQIRSLEAAMSNLRTLTVKASRQHIAKEMRRKESRKKKPNARLFRKPKQPNTPSPQAKKRVIKRQKKAPKEEVVELSPGYVFTPDYEAKDPVSVIFMRKGPRRTTYKNGDVKMEFPDGTTKTKHEGMTFTKYANGDYQQDYEDGTTYYRYSSNNSLEMRLTNGDVILLFEDGQKEEHFSSGRSRITYADKTIVTKE